MVVQYSRMHTVRSFREILATDGRLGNDILYWYIASFLKNEATTYYIDILRHLREFFDTYKNE
jgi:hypothetical protein